MLLLECLSSGVRYKPDVIKGDMDSIRPEVQEFYKKLGLYRGSQNNEMCLGTCSRTSDVVEPMINPQWFVNCNGMAKKALDANMDGRIEIIPKQYAAEWKRWLENIRDWCISRQLWWGHQIPAWYVMLENDQLKEFGAYNDHWVVGRNEEEAISEEEIKKWKDNQKKNILKIRF